MKWINQSNQSICRRGDLDVDLPPRAAGRWRLGLQAVADGAEPAPDRGPALAIAVGGDQAVDYPRAVEGMPWSA